jgi:hypothetical protein
MKPATPAAVFTLLLSVSLFASDGVVGDWKTPVDPDAPDTVPTQLSLQADETGAISGFMIASVKRYTIASAIVSGNSLVFSGVNLPEHNGDGHTISCNGVFAEGTIDLACQLPDGARRFVLAPNLNP